MIFVNSSYARILINSTPLEAGFNLGEEKKFDLNTNNRYDLSVKLDSIIGMLANFTLREIDEVIIIPDEKKYLHNETLVSNVSSNENNWKNENLYSIKFWIILIVIGLCLIILAWFKIRRLRRIEKGFEKKIEISKIFNDTKKKRKNT